MQIVVYTVRIFHRDNPGKISRNTYIIITISWILLMRLVVHHEDITMIISPGICNNTEI